MELKEKLAKAKNIIITTHQAPDGDAIGASLGMYNYLEKKGLNVAVIVPDEVPSYLKWMKGANDIIVFDTNKTKAIEEIEKADFIFCLDYNDLKRIGDVGQFVGASEAYKVMLDHHPFPSDFTDVAISDVSSCSTAQLVYDFIEEQGDSDIIDEIIGEGIYCGIVTDSGSFRFPSVQAKTHLIAADLIKKGLNHSRVHENIYDVNTLERLHLLGFALHEKLKVLPNLPVAVISLSLHESETYKVKKGYTEGLVNYALSIEGVKIAVFIREDKDKVKLSFRSKGNYAVNEFSGKYFNGGGHKNAAGGVCYGSFDETIKLVESKISEIIN